MQEASAPLLEMLSWPDNPIQRRIIPLCDAGYSPLFLYLFMLILLICCYTVSILYFITYIKMFPSTACPLKTEIYKCVIY